MLANIGIFFADKFRRVIPDSFIFALLLTILSGILALIIGDQVTPSDVIQSWYKGFWDLHSFAMQMILILVTGYTIAISPPATRLIDFISLRIKTPAMVYLVVVFAGSIFSLLSWGLVVLAAVLARELALRVEKVDYRLLAACVYVSFLPWHGGLSGSVPLLLNTPGNFLMELNVLTFTIPTSLTLGSIMNLVCLLALVFTLPVLMLLMRPPENRTRTIQDLMEKNSQVKEISIAEEVDNSRLPVNNLSDRLNNSLIIQMIICFAGLWFLFHYFANKGFDTNLDIMNFLFIIVGMLCHKTPARYLVAMKRSCGNVSGIILQFPFYAGIMGIMIHTGLGNAIAGWIVSMANIHTFPVISFLIGGFINIFVPSGGGEWAVVGPPIIEAARTLGANMPPDELSRFIARVAMAEAYGDSCTNMIQPFWTLAFFPVIASGIRMQARDIMGYTFIAMLWSALIFAICVTWMPI